MKMKYYPLENGDKGYMIPKGSQCAGVFGQPSNYPQLVMMVTDNEPVSHRVIVIELSKAAQELPDCCHEFTYKGTFYRLNPTSGWVHVFYIGEADA